MHVMSDLPGVCCSTSRQHRLQRDGHAQSGRRGRLNCCGVAGAQAAGCDSLFVAGGIHAEETGVQQTQQEMSREGTEKLFSEHGVEPTFVIPYLQC